MRIITGSAKGTKLKTPHGQEVRPTTDRVKESVFNILGSIVTGANVLDLFAGTGNLGLEALSRGARHAIFTDQSPVSLTLARENAKLTKLEQHAEFYKIEALKAIDKFIRQNMSFDLIFCDPPYNKGLAAAVARRIDASRLLTLEGVLVLEHSRHEELPASWQNLILKRCEHYGETMVSFLLYDKK